MAILEVKRASERHLKALTPTLPISFEGFDFEPPSGMYQICQFVIRPPEDPVLGLGYYRENIELQVFVSSPAGKGTGEAISRAELIREHFKKGTTFVESGIRIQVLRTPQVASDNVLSGRVVVPVIISLVAEIYN